MIVTVMSYVSIRITTFRKFYQVSTPHSGPPEALRTWLGQTLLALPFSFLYRAKILVLVIKGLNRSKDLVRTSPHYINRSQNMVRTSPRVLISSGGPSVKVVTLC